MRCRFFFIAAAAVNRSDGYPVDFCFRFLYKYMYHILSFSIRIIDVFRPLYSFVKYLRNILKFIDNLAFSETVDCIKFC